MTTPVTILTGFLGGGKTSLIRRLLASPWGKRIGILLNERGVAGIDDVGPSESGFIELSDGCVCCVDQPDLIKALTELTQRGNLDRILLETTGLADPLPISWTVARPDLASMVKLESVITVVDAANFERASHEEWSAQVVAADVIVLSKLDLASPEGAARARRAVRALNPRAPLLADEDALLALVGDDALFRGLFPEGRAGAPERAALRPQARHGDFRTVAVSEPALYDADALEDLVTDLPDDVFRAKGIARVRRSDGSPGWLGFQVVGGRASCEPDAAAPPHGECRMAFFGPRLDEQQLRARLDACRAG